MKDEDFKSSLAINMEEEYLLRNSFILLEEIKRCDSDDKKIDIIKLFLYSLREQEMVNTLNILNSIYFDRHSILDKIEECKARLDTYSRIREREDF